MLNTFIFDPNRRWIIMTKMIFLAFFRLLQSKVIQLHSFLIASEQITRRKFSIQNASIFGCSTNEIRCLYEKFHVFCIIFMINLLFYR